MTVSCKDIKTKDPVAFELCNELVSVKKIDPAQMDGSATTIDYRKNGLFPKKIKPNKKVDSYEIYQTYLKLAPVSERASAIFKQKFGTDPQWWMDGKTKAAIGDVIPTIRQNIAKSPNDNQTLITTREILNAIRYTMVISYKNHHESEADINIALQRKYVRCSEFMTVFWEIGKSFNLEMYPVEIHGEGDGKTFLHSAIMVYDRGTKTQYYVDIQSMTVTSNPRYDEYYPATIADLFASFLHNSSFKPNEKGKLRDEESIPLDNTLLVAPYNSLMLYAMSMRMFYKGKLFKSVEYSKQSVAIREKNKEALNFLCSFNESFSKDCPKTPKSDEPEYYEIIINQQP